jgi:hypothetical protein
MTKLLNRQQVDALCPIGDEEDKKKNNYPIHVMNIYITFSNNWKSSNYLWISIMYKIQ